MPRYKVKLTTLSPVHIGNGETYEPSQLFINDDKVFILHPNHFSDCLENENQTLKLKNYFLSGEQQSFLSDFEGFNFEKIKDCSTYNSSLHCKIDSKDKKIWKIVRNPLKNFKPFIPGSSLKGALFTPIFSDFFFHKEREEDTLEKLENQLKRNNSFELESQLKRFHQSTNKNERIKLKKNWKRQAKDYLENLKSLYKQFEEASYIFSPNLPRQSKIK
ncbi:type III-A CRISPR-associated RAMP protein Csm5, partial [bacterium]|nr:type III-A CRISPR-associated RAMP protein Csm5 [bacterium]